MTKNKLFVSFKIKSFFIYPCVVAHQRWNVICPCGAGVVVSRLFGTTRNNASNGEPKQKNIQNNTIINGKVQIQEIS